METESDKAPELSVETESIRRNSNPVSDLTVHQPSEIPAENKTLKTGIVISKTTQDLHSEFKNETSIKRVDSDSKFGVMETIPLEIPSQETPPICSEQGDAANKSADSELVIKSSEENLETQSQAMCSNEKADSGSGSETNSLSKYFSLNPSDSFQAEGVEFFDAISSITKENDPKTTKQEIQVGDPTTDNPSNASTEKISNEVQDLEKNTEHSVSNEATKQPPVLLKFFAEDKSGTDADGKAFFDKIAEVKTPDDSAPFEIKEPVLTSSLQNQFLSSPVLHGEIEDSWIPSKKTHQALVSAITSSSFSLDKSQLTMPGIIIEEEMEDPVKALLIECNSPQAQNRKALSANDIPEDETGLQKLIEAECYHAAINLTKRLLTACGQGPGDEGKPSKHTPLSLRLWYTRLALLVKLKKFSYAEVESAAFGELDKPDLYYEFYPDIYKGKRGTMVPFSFRLLLAELPQYQGNYQVALDNLYRILHVIQKILWNVQNGCAEDGSMIELSDSRKQASLEIWRKREKRILYSILNCVLSQKDYILAVSVTKILLEKSEDVVPELYSALGRIYLQLGDVKYAQECFNKALTMSHEESFQVEDLINKALLAIAHNNNEEAYKFYKQAHSLRPDNAMLANNLAVCLLYMGQLKESLSLLEKTIHKNPSSCLHDGILFNACTLYELESSRCTQKKLAMLELVSKYVGDSFNVSCLKIQPMAK